MKNKYTYLAILLLVILIIGLDVWFFSRQAPKNCPANQTWNVTVARCESEVVSSHDGAINNTYNINDEPVRLIKGVSVIAITSDYAVKQTTKYFGNEAKGDLNGDGIEDVAFILTQDTGGSGIFYYVAVALGSNQGYRGLNAVLLGDRIAPQTTEIKAGQVVVNYADRLPDEPFTTSPSVGKSRYLQVSDDNLVEVEKIIQ